jgi:3-deoxy-7-phosphoheptulonate synthase
MIVVMKSGTSSGEIERISKEIRSWNITPEKCVGHHKVVIGLVGDTAVLNPQQIQQLSPFIERVMRVEQPFKRASREFRHGERVRWLYQHPMAL